MGKYEFSFSRTYKTVFSCESFFFSLSVFFRIGPTELWGSRQYSIKDLLMSRENGSKAGLLCPPASALRISAQWTIRAPETGVFQIKQDPNPSACLRRAGCRNLSAGPVRAPGLAICGLECRRLAANSCVNVNMCRAGRAE